MCILVVEDDFLIRMLLVEELIDAGYHVLEAETGDAALTLLHDGIDPPLKLMVTDIHMPGKVNGVQLASHFRDAMPDVPIIYTTGRPDALADVPHLGRHQYLVRKPYVPSEIIARIQQLLPA